MPRELLELLKLKLELELELLELELEIPELPMGDSRVKAYKAELRAISDRQ